MAELRPLEIRALGHRYGDTPVIAHLDLMLEPGELVAVLGASGCGKTTLLRSVAGLVTPTSGAISVHGQVVVDGGHERIPIERRGIGLVFQDYALFPTLDVRRNVGYAGVDPVRVDELLERVGLSELGDRYPAELSGGQQQRVALARALAPRPELLLLDEPFANVDANRRSALGASLRDTLAAEGRAALLVTHDRHDALGLADRVLVMVPGSAGATVGQLDSPEQVYSEPASPEVARLTGPGAVLEVRDGRTMFGPAPEGARHLVVRPEQLEIRADGPHLVRHTRFLGDRVAHWIETPAGLVEAYADRRHEGTVDLVLSGGHPLQ